MFNVCEQVDRLFEGKCLFDVHMFEEKIGLKNVLLKMFFGCFVVCFAMISCSHDF